MAKKTSEQGKKTVERKRKPILVYLDDDLLEGMRRLCYEKRYTRAAWIRNLIFEKLREESYLKKEPKVQ